MSRVQIDGSRKDISINKPELKWNPLKHRHLKKELPTEQFYGEGSQASSEETAGLGVAPAQVHPAW